MSSETSKRTTSDDVADRSRRELPLTAAQLGIWHAQQLDPFSTAYQGGEYLEIAGPVDATRLEQAVRQTLHEAQTLRARDGGTGRPPAGRGTGGRLDPSRG